MIVMFGEVANLESLKFQGKTRSGPFYKGAVVLFCLLQDIHDFASKILDLPLDVTDAIEHF